MPHLQRDDFEEFPQKVIEARHLDGAESPANPRCGHTLTAYLRVPEWRRVSLDAKVAACTAQRHVSVVPSIVLRSYSQ